MIMRDANGDYEIYDIVRNAILAAYSSGPVGPEWQVAGLGGFNSPDTTDMIQRDSNTGAFEVYDISHNGNTSAASLGQVGLGWMVAGIAADPPTASSAASIVHLVQAMASSGASGAVNSAPGAVLGGADTSQQTLLTLPQPT